MRLEALLVMSSLVPHSRHRRTWPCGPGVELQRATVNVRMYAASSQRCLSVLIERNLKRGCMNVAKKPGEKQLATAR